MYELRVMGEVSMDILRSLLGDIVLYGLNGDAGVDATLSLVRRVHLTPITTGEGYVLAFSMAEFGLLREYLEESLHQGEFGCLSGDQFVGLTKVLDIPGWVYADIRDREV